jgi:hypothetical protein
MHQKIKNIEKYRINDNNKVIKILIFLKILIVYIALSYLIFSIIITVYSFFIHRNVECKYFECNLFIFLDIDNLEHNLEDLNNIEKQLNISDIIIIRKNE